ncbi:MAG TPA: hypothetical protein VHX88_18295 [Solirubrobacteraceae bacterium]|jgi:hypothetical protein|nr:hypothetical protein [Solirubrobacteraceae bacterium]
MRRFALILAALSLGAAAAIAPAIAVSQDTSTPTVTVLDSASCPGGGEWPYCFQQGANENPTVTIPVGGTVDFSQTGATSPSNVDFGAMQPSSCTGIPNTPTTSDWSGSCTFDSAGTYPFHSDGTPESAYMSGEIVVGSSSTTSTGTSTGTGTGTSTGTTPVPNGTTASPSVTTAVLAALKTISAPHKQRGTRVIETFESPQRGLRVRMELIGPHDEVLGKGSHTTTGAGIERLSVTLSSAGKRALQRSHDLELELRTLVSGGGLSTPHGAKRTVTLSG